MNLFLPIETIENNLTASRGCTEKIYVPYCTQGNHPRGMLPNGLNCPAHAVREVSWPCGGGGGGDGSGGGGDGPAGIGTTTPYPPCEGCPQTPFGDFLSTLPQEELDWLLGENLFRMQIQFFLQNNDSPESKSFARKAVKALMENPSLTFDYLLNNKNPYTDVNTTGDINNNPVGGYDNASYPQFNPQQQWPTISNVISTSEFIGWNYSGINRNCMDYAKAQIAGEGYQISNYFNGNGQTIQIYTSQNGVDTQAVENAISYLIYALDNGIPIIVGVDAHSGSPNPQTDNTTDHFVVIVGMGSDANGNYFVFFDNASAHPLMGASKNNKLYYDSNSGLITGESQTGYDDSPNHPYIVTHIRKSKQL